MNNEGEKSPQLRDWEFRNQVISDKQPERAMRLLIRDLADSAFRMIKDAPYTFDEAFHALEIKRRDDESERHTLARLFSIRLEGCSFKHSFERGEDLLEDYSETLARHWEELLRARNRALFSGT